MTLNVAIVIERANIALGGAERSVFELATALRNLDIRVDVLAAKGQTKTANIHILCPDASGKRTSFAAFSEALQAHLRTNNYDLLHSVLPFDFADIYQPRGGTYTEAMIRNAASYPTRLLQAYKHLTAFANTRRTALMRAEKRLCKKPDGPTLVALSDYVGRQFKTHYGVGDDRIVVIPNGVRVHKKLDPKTADKLRAHILARLKITEADNPLFFLFVANNFRLKGLTPLIHAMAEAPCYDRPTFLIVAGSGRSHKYRLLARRLNVHDRIAFLGPIRHIQNALSITDVAVLPTFYDPASRYILEALAAAKPVITTEFNGAVDLFVDNIHGKVIDSPRNVAALAEAIGHFSRQDNIRQACEAIVRDDVKSQVSVTRVANQLAELYDKILTRKDRS